MTTNYTVRRLGLLDKTTVLDTESHDGADVSWAFTPAPCCSTCMIRDLRVNHAEIGSPDDLDELIGRLAERPGWPFDGQRMLLARIAEAWRSRGVDALEQVTLAMEAAARIGGPTADRLALAIVAVLDAAALVS